MYHRFHGRCLQRYSQVSQSIYAKVILTIYQFMPEGIFHEMHRRRNILPPATTYQALRAARPKGRPRA